MTTRAGTVGDQSGDRMKWWRRPKLPNYGARLLASATANRPPTDKAVFEVDEANHRIRTRLSVDRPPAPGGPLFIFVEQSYMPLACDITFEMRTDPNQAGPLATRRVRVADGTALLKATFDGDELAAAGVTEDNYRSGLIVDLAFHSGWSKGVMA